MNAKVTQIMQQYWGTSQFRPGQQEVVSAVLDKQDCLVVLPTGGGKSLCYQLPGIVLPGICIVVSPLIALMNDQVEGLQKKGIRAMHLSGPLRENELITALDNCKFGNFKFLYLSPERAKHPIVLEHLSQMPISLLAIDEAHCISEWGHDFRPAYRELIALKDTLGGIPTMAVTATATAKVQEDISTTLKLKSPKRVIGSFDRPNIELHAIHSVEKLDAIAEALEHRNTPAIVYVGTRKSAELLSEHLNNMGHKTAFFHGGATEKEKRVQDWMLEKTPVMVATTAFGMGIDKPNVQRIVHATLPYSMEQYYQEIGRCGRNGGHAIATLIYADGDEKKLHNRLLSSIPKKEIIQKSYKYLCHYFDIAYGEKPEMLLELNLELFCSRYEIKQKMIYDVLKLLERSQILQLIQYETPRTTLRLTPNSIGEYEKLEDYLLRNFGGITDRFQSFNLARIAAKCQLSVQQCVDTIHTMIKNGTAEVLQLHVDNGIQFLVPREDNRTLNGLLYELESIKKEKKRLSSFIWDYCTSKKCLRAQLLAYFGEKSKKNCESCSNCKGNKNSLEDVIYSLKNLLSYTEALSLEELARDSVFTKSELIKALNSMTNEDLIQQVEFNKYKLV